MSANTVLLIAFLVRTAWIVAVFSVTTFLVFWKDASGWWFLLAILITAFNGEVEKK